MALLRKKSDAPEKGEEGDAEGIDPQSTAEFRAQIAESTTDKQVAERVGISVATLRRWVKAGAIPEYEGTWTTSAIAHARIVAQLRKSGEPLAEIIKAAQDGRLALGGVDALFAVETGTYTLKQAAKKAGVKPSVAGQIWISLGRSIQDADNITEQDIEALRRVQEVLDAGVPLSALLQVIRVAAKAFADIADAEARLIRMFVHEPLLQQGASPDEINDVMGTMIEGVLPHIAPLFEYMHQSYLQDYAEQVQIENVIGTTMTEATTEGLVNVAVCFADIAGFTRYTEEEGVEKAFEQADRLRQQIETTLPDSARLIKLTGDGAMIIGSEPSDLVAWAVRLAGDPDETFSVRVGLDFGEALYRDGDYFGGVINMAARVLGRAATDEVLVTEQVRSHVKERKALGLRFVSIGKVRLKGFDDVIELFRVESRNGR